MKALRKGGTSANISYYGEPVPQSDERLWCEVLRESLMVDPDTAERKLVLRPDGPSYHFSVYRGYSSNKIADFSVEGVGAPQKDLSAEEVTRIVAERLDLEVEEA